MARAPRILIVEDVLLIAMDIEAVVRASRCDVVGPVARLDQAVDLARSDDLDAAILDLHLGGGDLSTPVAQILRRRSIPFAFLTGHADPEIMPAGFANELVLEKPLGTRRCRRAIAQLTGWNPDPI
jgi:DNA-binding NarL/FixJ family response regulator